MAYSITSNRKNTAFVVHSTPGNSTIIVAGNSSTSNVATSNEILTGAYIAQAVWGTDGGHIQVLRGSTLVAVYESTGQKDYAGCGIPITVGQGANLVINYVGTANAYIMLECQKVGQFTSDYNNP